ncbi:hypothetical protein IVB22_11695 [Bradyrhizobium sp. 190]|uniref:hypothetical protein n=1 Tax=Bradyrhizobium sp. 190 TaxID=2782658 RepID=UPI001FF70FAD|nr:hypothetical protein [Bradyrhizobium sp. 190]MCK1513221.1 hypothetical protein [Bradyrhizobium sp. 190]
MSDGMRDIIYVAALRIFEDQPSSTTRGEAIVTVEHPRLAALQMPAEQPRFSRTPAPKVHAGPDLGAHTKEVLRELAGVSAEKLAELRKTGTVQPPDGQCAGRVSKRFAGESENNAAEAISRPPA